MRKILTILCILLTTNALSQVQKYTSFQQLYGEAGYFEQFNDTIQITIQRKITGTTLYIQKSNLLQIRELDNPRSYINSLGMHVIKYDATDYRNLPESIEFLYNDAKLIQICVTQLIGITTLVINPKKEMYD